MDSRYIDLMREQYAEKLVKEGDMERALELLAEDEYIPILEVVEAHPEEEPDPATFNKMTDEIIHDLTILSTEFGGTANKIKALMENTKTRLNAVKEILKAEQERQQDINILCNKYSEFAAVKALSSADFTGQFGTENGAICAGTVSTSDIDFEIISIEGNGYEGNKYVLKDNVMLETLINTAERKALYDKSLITVYEYSRITADNTEHDTFPEMNFDSIEAKCSIILKSKVAFNKLKLNSESKDIKLISLGVSTDGVIFQEAVQGPIKLNDPNLKYEGTSYIPESGILCFPNTNYVKITLQSDGYTADTIAFYKTEIQTPDVKDLMVIR